MRVRLLKKIMGLLFQFEWGTYKWGTVRPPPTLNYCHTYLLKPKVNAQHRSIES